MTTRSAGSHTAAPLPHDPRWPRASEWLTEGTDTCHVNPQLPPDLAILGVPTHLTSISPTQAHTTPAAVRRALARYSVWAESTRTDLRELLPVDLGDVADPDDPDSGEARVMQAVDAFAGQLLIALGGDNSLTYPVTRGLHATGLVTLDAHHDLRDGRSNGSPVARLITDGVIDPRRIVQVGLSDFANSPDYAAQAHDAGITLITRGEVESTGIVAAMTKALVIAGAREPGDVGPPRVHVDVDVDVCDRAVVPACPAAAPGGLSAWELRQAARCAGRDRRVVGIDFAEVDAAADAADERTVRLVALGVLEAAAGLATRPASTLAT